MAFQQHSQSSPRYSRRGSEDSALPGIFSWSKSIETFKSQEPLSYAQSFPSDIRASHDFDAYSDVFAPTMSIILDRTTIDIGFDFSCLDGLDAQLLYSPVDAFAAICWDSATCAPLPTGAKDLSWAKHPVTHPSGSSDESESESEECHTNDDLHSSILPDHSEVNLSQALKVASADTNAQIYDLSLTEHLVSLGPHFTTSDPKESIGFFPMPNQNRRTKHVSIASFRAHLPPRFMKPSLAS